ncbi:MAG: GDP-mannose 4,6-dehydratase [Thermoplasmatota archaeon]
MKKVLVTGGCGFIGTNFIDYLMDKTDWKVSILDNLSVGKLEYLESIENYSEDRIDFTEGDIRDKEEVEKAISDSQVVVHLAAQTGVIPSVENPKEDADINIMGTLNLLEASVDNDIERFAQASSAAPLGEQEQPVHEGKVPGPLAPYGASKLACEGYCSAFAASYSLQTTALRFSNVYGPNSWHKGSVVAKFIRQILDDEQLTIFGDGEQTRDFIHTRDISQAIYRSLTEDLQNDFELFQLGTGEETSVNELYETIEEKLEGYDIKSPGVIHGDERAGEILRSYADVSKAKEMLGYEPKVDLSEGIDETIEWFMENY